MEQLSFFEAERLLLPEIDSMLEKRIRILRAIHLAGTIGRRALCEVVQMTEREVRNETDVLKRQNLILILQKGMICTEQGYEVLEKLSALYYELSGLTQKEQRLAAYFGIEQVIIVAGDLEKNTNMLQLLGKEASDVLQRVAKPNSKIALTGGQSVAAVASFLQNQKLHNPLFIPARGGIGEDIQYQANTLAAQFAQESNGQYRTLYTPEHLSEQAYLTMIHEPSVAAILSLYDEVNIVVHGIGAAEEMVIRRNSSTEVRELLASRGAVGESFGYYYDEQGNIVHHIRTIGIQLEQVQKSDKVIAIAGGAKKAKAIQAYFKNASPHTILITDESAANAIIRQLS